MSRARSSLSRFSHPRLALPGLAALLLGLALAAPALAEPPRRAGKPAALELVKLPPAPLPRRDAGMAGSFPAPVPNRELEAPSSKVVERPRLDPSIIHRPLPSRGAAAEGSVSRLEEKLFEPAPGARLRLPFSY
ncbi:hypothetical protein [Siccirubricoccus phaeus]|uniref:hypothetical protein n=1 Tax=Siccirubricoccus phaeus TaxID=2595053 RepID=UPI0011F35AE0|nr:hypothetical protein [Siccirubricoccus phaeus]